MALPGSWEEGELLVRGVICTRESRDGRGARLIMHTTQKSCQAMSTLSTLTSEKCRYSGRKIYPGRKIWSLICPIPDASVQALEQVKEVGGFFSSIKKFSYQLQLQIELHIFGYVDVREWERETAGSPPHLSNLGCEQSSPSIRPPIIRLLSSPRPRGIHWYPVAIPTTMGDCTPILCSTAPPTRPLWGRVSENFGGEGRALEGGLSLLRNFLWAKHRAVLRLHKLVARNTGTSAIEWWNVGRTGNNSGIRTGQSR